MPLYLGSTLVGLPGSGSDALTPFQVVDSTGGNSINVTSSATTGEKGAWVQMIAATTADANFMFVTVQEGENNVNSSTKIDVGLGASGAETTIVPDLPVSGLSSWPVIIPIAIPSGSRVSIRKASLAISRARGYRVHLMKVPLDIGNSVDVLGANGYTGVVINSSTAWFEVVASTSRDYRNIIIVPAIVDTWNPTPLGSYIAAGYGPSGSEVDFGNRVSYRASNTEDIYHDHLSWGHTPFFSTIAPGVPAGSRLVVRSTTTATVSATLIGVP